jgi:hypothetical protein
VTQERRVPRRGEVWDTQTQTVLVISSTVYNQIADELTILVALVTDQATEEGFCVHLGDSQWAVMGLVTFIAKTALTNCRRRVSAQAMTDADNMLFKILATPEQC